MDPRRWSTDPVQRIIGEQADKNRAAQNNFFNSKPTQNSNSNEINPELAGAAILGAGAIIVAAIAATAVAAYGAVKITYESIRWGLNHKEGVDQTNNKNNEKAGWLTAGFFATAGAIGLGIYAYNELQNKKYPAIALSFSKSGKGFIAQHEDKNQAVNNSNSYCNRGWFSFCSTAAYIEAGSKACISYSNITFVHTRYNMKTNRKIQTESNHPFFAATSYKPEINDPNIIKGCEKVALKDRFPLEACRNRDVKTVCNFN